MTLRAVTFDFWSTLVDGEITPERFAQRVARLHAVVVGGGHACTPDELGAAVERTLKRVGEEARENLIDVGPPGRWAVLASELGIPDGMIAYDLIEQAYAEITFEPLPAAMPHVHVAVRAMQQAGYRLGVICNTGMVGGRVLREVLKRHGLLDFFDVTVFSNEFGVSKPHPSIFVHTLQELGGIAPHEALHVGDLEELDVEGARRAGVHSARYVPGSDGHVETDANLVITDWRRFGAQVAGYAGQAAAYAMTTFVSAAEAVQQVHSRNRVFLHGAAATPAILLDALVARATTLEHVEVVHLHADGPAPHVADEMEGHLRHRALFIGANVRAAVNEGRADFVPIFLSDIPHLFSSGALPLDVAFVQVSPPDAHGYCSLGTSVDAAKAAVASASTVIAQINAGMPRTLGDSFIHLDQIDWAVRADCPLLSHPTAPISPTEKLIGEYIADLVEDGATLQLGIGGIPNAALAAMGGKHDLGVHTEMFSDGLLDLVDAGVVNCAAKTLHPGKIVTTFLMGSQRLYDWVDDNPMIEMHPVDYTNDTAIIRRNARMTAINSAIEVDLTGQVCADSMGTHLYSGVGGQMDFMRGAALSPGGKPIIALPSTAKQGSVSRIVPTLAEGAGVTTTRAHVHYIVTEHGVAYLHGKSIRERAEALMRIAHPAFRDELRDWARRTHYL